MPPKFVKCNKAGGRVRTVTRGSNKGRLICMPKGKGHPVLGHKRGHKKRR